MPDMADSETVIPRGYILKARKIDDSEVAHAPPHIREIWDLLLRKANYRDYKTGGKTIRRGQLLTSYQDILDDLSWRVGYRIERYTKHQCENAMKWLRKRSMITTARTTRGLIVTVLNYDKYQDPKNYECRDESSSECYTSATMTPHDKGKKKRKKKKEEESLDLFSEIAVREQIRDLVARYPNPDLIQQAFAAFASTRKSGKVKDSVLLAQLKKWERYTVERVEAGIRIYLDRDYASQGKREDYLLGIIRKIQPQTVEPETTGSALLDWLNTQEAMG